VIWVAYTTTVMSLIAGSVYLIVHNHPWFGGLLLLMAAGMSVEQGSAKKEEA
jgi:hypothetical protein